MTPECFSRRTLVERDRLIEDNLDLVPQIARQLHRRIPTSFLLEDLIATGNLALVTAAERWDETRGVPFRSYAYIPIRGAMVESYRRRNYDWSQVKGEDDLPETFLVRDPAIEIDSVRMAQRIAAAMDELSPRQREVVDLYYGEREMLLREISEVIEIGPSRTSQIRAQGVTKLREVISRRPARSKRRISGAHSPVTPPLKQKR